MSKQALYGYLNRSGFYGDGNDTLCAPFTLLAAAETDTGYDLVRGDVVLDVFVVVKTAEATDATKTIDVGLLSGEAGGDADGFLDGASVAAIATVIGVLVAGGVTRGALLRETVTGSGAATHNSPKPYVVGSTALSLTYTPVGAFTECVADIYVRLWRPLAQPGQ